MKDEYGSIATPIYAAATFVHKGVGIPSEYTYSRFWTSYDLSYERFNFGSNGSGFQRINIATPRSNLKYALDKLYDVFKEY